MAAHAGESKEDLDVPGATGLVLISECHPLDLCPPPLPVSHTLTVAHFVTVQLWGRVSA